VIETRGAVGAVVHGRDHQQVQRIVAAEDLAALQCRGRRVVQLVVLLVIGLRSRSCCRAAQGLESSDGAARRQRL
jgi:hypothetical protein